MSQTTPSSSPSIIRLSSIMNSRTFTQPVDQEAREFLKHEMEGCFHMDDNIFKLLDMPKPENSTWHNRAKAVFKEYSNDEHIKKQINALPQKKPSALTRGKAGTGKAAVGDPAPGEPEIVDENENQRRERTMYPPLLEIFNWVTERGQPSGSEDFEREWCILAEHGPVRDGVLVSSNNRKPDLALVERKKSMQLAKDPKPYWRQVSVTVEVKWNTSDGPTTSSVVLNDAVLQTIDQMRMHLCSRPFMRWVFGLLICGTDFYLLYLDRAGGVISTAQNIRDDSRLFVEIILRVSGMERTQLGQDPDVRFGKHTSDGKLDRRARPSSQPWDASFPSYTFPGFTSGGGRIRTIEEPIFVTLGSLGRGTTVWKVKDAEERELIMKYSWRSVSRTSESTIYSSIQDLLPDRIPGICRFVNGADAVWSGSFLHTELLQLADPAINPLRSYLSSSLPRERDRIVHKLLLETRGIPIREFENSEHLVKVLVSALHAHKKLADIGILHRDISSGNILITKEREHPGVLADLELAKILPEHDSRLAKLVPDLNHISSRPEITCTIHFTSYQLLDALDDHDLMMRFVPCVRHDLEGFFWVMVWAILIKSLSPLGPGMPDPTPQQIKAANKRRATLLGIFGPNSITRIMSERYSFLGAPHMRPDALFPVSPVDDAEFDAFRALFTRLRALFKPVIENYEDITHRQVILALDPDHDCLDCKILTIPSL